MYKIYFDKFQLVTVDADNFLIDGDGYLFFKKDNINIACFKAGVWQYFLYVNPQD